MKLFASFILAGLLSASMLAHAQPLTVAWKTIRPPEMDTLRYLEVQFAGDKFTLVPPNGCGIKTDLPSATIQLSASTGSVSMTIQFSTNSSRAILASKDAMQQYAAPQEANTEVREEFPAYSSTTPGRGIELRFKLHDQWLWRRAAVVPFSGGYAGFIATSTIAESKAAHEFFGGVLTSFQQASKTTGQ